MIGCCALLNWLGPACLSVYRNGPGLLVSSGLQGMVWRGSFPRVRLVVLTDTWFIGVPLVAGWNGTKVELCFRVLCNPLSP